MLLLGGFSTLISAGLFPVPWTLKRHTRLLTAPYDPLNPEHNFEAYAVFVKTLLAQHAGDDASLRHVY